MASGKGLSGLSGAKIYSIIECVFYACEALKHVLMCKPSFSRLVEPTTHVKFVENYLQGSLEDNFPKKPENKKNTLVNILRV